jgi:hypothetical protein
MSPQRRTDPIDLGAAASPPYSISGCSPGGTPARFQFELERQRRHPAGLPALLRALRSDLLGLEALELPLIDLVERAQGAIGIEGLQDMALFLDRSFLITASFWAWLVWGDTLDTASVFGVVLIIASGTVIALSPQPAARAPAE